MVRMMPIKIALKVIPEARRCRRSISSRIRALPNIIADIGVKCEFIYEKSRPGGRLVCCIILNIKAEHRFDIDGIEAEGFDLRTYG